MSNPWTDAADKMSGGGKILNFQKGAPLRIRIVDKQPTQVLSDYKGKSSIRLTTRVILKESTPEGVKKTVKGWAFGSTVSGIIGNLANEPEWGGVEKDVTLFDLKVTKLATEEDIGRVKANAFWSVVAVGQVRPLSPEDLQLVKESDIDLYLLFGSKNNPAQSSGARQSAQDGEEEEDNDPFADE